MDPLSYKQLGFFHPGCPFFSVCCAPEATLSTLHALLLPWLTEQEARKSCAVSESSELGLCTSSAWLLEEPPPWSQSRHTPVSLGWATACLLRVEGSPPLCIKQAGWNAMLCLIQMTGLGKPGQHLSAVNWEVPELEIGQEPPWGPGAAQTSAENHDFFLCLWGMQPGQAGITFAYLWCVVLHRY